MFIESTDNEEPLNIYGYSKYLFDQLVRRRWSDNTAQVVGLRYFNVYGPREAHKEKMASVVPSRWLLPARLQRKIKNLSCRKK